MLDFPAYVYWIAFAISPVLYLWFVNIIGKCFSEESQSPQANHVSEISQDHGVATEIARDVTAERARVMEVVIDIPEDDPKIEGINSDCCICLGEFEEEEDAMGELILSACCHRFHAACVMPWLFAKNKTCPLCRTCISTIATYARVEDLNKSLNDHQSLQFSDTDKRNYIASVQGSTITFSIQENPLM